MEVGLAPYYSADCLVSGHIGHAIHDVKLKKNPYSHCVTVERRIEAEGWALGVWMPLSLDSARYIVLSHLPARK
jgi:hypothetical protein